MTKRELIQALENIDDDDQVYIQDPEYYDLLEIKSVETGKFRSHTEYYGEDEEYEIPREEWHQFKNILFLTSS